MGASLDSEIKWKKTVYLTFNTKKAASGVAYYLANLSHLLST